MISGWMLGVLIVESTGLNIPNRGETDGGRVEGEIIENSAICAYKLM